MSTGACAACGGQTVFEEELGSAICVSCGTLANPSQNILDSHLDRVDSSGRDYYPHGVPVAGGSTLKGRNGRALAGQDKEARERRNMIAMHEFISAIASRLSHPGSAPRAQAIFDQAMSSGKYRWGKKAKRTAGASLAVSLREAKKSVSLRDIAFLIDEPLVSIARSFSTVCTLLQLKIPPNDTPQPSSNPNSKESLLPHTLVTALTPLIPRLPAVRNTVTSLASLVARNDSSLAQLPSAPSACALFMLALEGELSASLPNAGALAQALGARVSVSKAVVMQRYKIIYDLVEECVKEVPWLDDHERKPSKGGKGRSKVAKRVVVAKGLKDVVQFQDEIWRRRFLGTAILFSCWRRTPTTRMTRRRQKARCTRLAASVPVSSASRQMFTDIRAPARNARRDTTRTSRKSPSICFSRTQVDPVPAGARLTRIAKTSFNIPHSGRLSPRTRLRASATRLQLLANARGGEQAVDDDELFEEGELEGLMRDPEEVLVIRSTMDWDWDAPVTEESSDHRAAKRKRTGSGGEKTKVACGKQRIDMDVLARLLDPETVTDEDGGHLEGAGAFVGEDDLVQDFGFDFDFDWGEQNTVDEVVDEREPASTPALTSVDRPTVHADGGGGEEEVVEEWRPMSPGGGGAFDDDDRYDF
ncbi:hypothetical protein BC629DRAFT_1589911 [Irpex lacteus]|nr:hypothetical protein BC629DRAFT_1589911 [Irpex lacteus]